MLIEFSGRVLATPSAMTVLFNGTEVFSGQVGAGQPLDQSIILTTHEWASNTASETASVSISVTSGVLDIAACGYSFDDVDPTTDCRVSSTILINGVAPEWPATPVEPRMPNGTEQDPDWSYWGFEVSAGETITFNIENTWTPAGNTSPT